MIAPAIPDDETWRLAALHTLQLLDTAPEADFDAIVRLGQALFNVPTCLVTLVDRDRQWFKARIGLDDAQTPRNVSFCGHAILRDDVFVVPDATRDDRFHDNPLVTGPPHIRFYAGAPIRLPNGYTIGTVCILGPEPRSGMSATELAQLCDLAELALAAISLRALRSNLDQAATEAARLRLVLTALPQPVALADAQGRLTLANEAFSLICTAPPVDGMAITDLLGIATAIWSPAAMQESGAHEATIPPSDGRPALTIWRDAEGLVLQAV
jgi:GAF domain-containing protein